MPTLSLDYLRLPDHRESLEGESAAVAVNDLQRRGLSRKTILNALSTLAVARRGQDWNCLSLNSICERLRLPVEDLQTPQRFSFPTQSQRYRRDPRSCGFLEPHREVAVKPPSCVLEFSVLVTVRFHQLRCGRAAKGYDNCQDHGGVEL